MLYWMMKFNYLTKSFLIGISISNLIKGAIIPLVLYGLSIGVNIEMSPMFLIALFILINGFHIVMHCFFGLLIDISIHNKNNQRIINFIKKYPHYNIENIYSQL